MFRFGRFLALAATGAFAAGAMTSCAGLSRAAPAESSDYTVTPQAGFLNDGRELDTRARSENLFEDVPLTQFFGRAAQDPGAAAGEAGARPGQDRMLVYRGAMTVEVARTEDAMAAFLGQVEGWGGYLSAQRGPTLTVRLPAVRFDEAFAALRDLGRVLDESREASDVTEEYLDLEIRLDNARRARERLLALLDKADKVEDILKVEEQLRRLTEEIERMEGRRKYLADQVAMATVQATFVAPSDQPEPERRRRPSRFGWIRAVGAERVVGGW